MTEDIPTEPVATPAPPPGGARLGGMLRSSGFYMAANLASRAVSFVMIPFYAHFLSVAQYDVVNLVELSAQIVAIAFGLQTIGAVLPRLYHDRPDGPEREAVAGTAALATTALSAIVSIFALLAAHPIARLLALPDQVALLRAVFVAMFLGSVTEIALVYERMRGRAAFFAGYSIATLLGTVGLNILFIGALGFGVWGFVSSKLVLTSVAAAFLTLRLARDTGLRWRPGLLREFARLGAPLVLSAVSYFVIHFSDRVFLNHAVSRDESGRYWLAYNFAMLLSILVGDSFAKAWNVSFYRYAEDPGWRARFARVARWLVLVLGTAAVAIALFGDDALRLMVPPAYRAPTLLIAILVFGYVFREVGDFFLNLMMLDRRSGTIGRLAAGSAVLNLALNVWLIPSYGLYGAALATLLTWAVYLIACWRVAQRQHRLPFPIRPALGLLAAGLAAVGGGAALPASNVGGSILIHGGLLLAFAAFAWVAYLSREEREDVARILLSLKKKKQKDF